MTYRLARSLDKLFAQVNAAAPNRSKASDGWIGNNVHAGQGSDSDHNPWFVFGNVGIVTAIDITHDPAHGCDVWEIAQAISASRDHRLKYMIYTGGVGGNPGILSQTVSPWVWRVRAYDDHPHHLHISVNSNSADFDSVSSWSLSRSGTTSSTPAGSSAGGATRPSQASLLVDGNMGAKTITRLQQILGTPADGVISAPSMMVSALQRFLNSRGGHLVVDGRGLVQANRVRTQTNATLQRYLGTPADGELSSPDSLAVRRLQQHLNTGRL